MLRSGFLNALRDVVAMAVVFSVMFPIVWWGLTSLKTGAAIFDKDRVVLFDFQPTLANYALTMGEGAPEAFGVRDSLLSSLVIAGGSVMLSVGAGLLAAFGLYRFPWRYAGGFLSLVLVFRFVPPVALVVPSVALSHPAGLFDTHIGVILMHTLLNLPVAILMLKSFIEDVPREVIEAAWLDGAGSFRILLQVVAPAIKGGIAATAVICFIFSWTEFLMALFLTVSFRTLPIKLSILSMGMWGPLAAAGTAAMIPGLVFILVVQRHLVRGLTLGHQK